MKQFSQQSGLQLAALSFHHVCFCMGWEPRVLGHPWGEHPPRHLPPSAVPDDVVLMSSAALVVTGERDRGREPWLGRALKPTACLGRAKLAAPCRSVLLVPAKRRVRGLHSPQHELSVFLSARICLPLCTFPCKRQFLTANISQKPEPALSLPPFFPSLSLLFMKLRVSV